MHEVIIENVRAVGATGDVVMILKEKEGMRTIPIWIGLLEAQSISIALEQIPFPRPLTHDLFLITLGKFGARIKSVIITGVALNTFFAKIQNEQGKETIELDARPSDGVALALRAQAPILAADELFPTPNNSKV